MSDAYKCDRCGVFFEKDIGCASLDYRIVVSEEKRSEVRDYDMCTECSDAFAVFLRVYQKTLPP